MPNSEAVDIARRSAKEITRAVHRWTDTAQPTAGSLAVGLAEPSDPHAFLDEFFDFFEGVLTRQRTVAQRQLADVLDTSATHEQAGASPNEHDRTTAMEPDEPASIVSDARATRGVDLSRASLWQVAGIAPPAADDDRNQESATLAELAQAFAALAQALATEHGVAPVSPRRIIQLAADCMPRVQHAALIAVRDGEVRSLAATANLPDRIDRIRSDTGQGPGLDVLQSNELVVSNDVAADPRWPLFGRRIVDELGLRSIVSYRLYLGPHDRAALNLYSDWPHAFDNLAITMGAVFAAYCSLATFSRLPHRPRSR